jgi:GPH family glycoside/pentoside/hexuronide:cation symporter
MAAPGIEHVPFLKKLAYAAPAFALAVVGIPIYVYLPKFYTDVVGIDIAALGYILSSVRIFDAVTDPPMGYISDRTVSRFGRRRPYIAVGAVFVALFIYLLFNPPEGSPSFETAWFGICIYALFLFWTVVTVPYESLGPEITLDYNERNTLFALRDGLLIAGTLAAAVSPAVVQAAFGLAPDPAGERTKFFWIAVLYAPLVIGSAWWCALAIRERPSRERPVAGIWSGLRLVFRNRPFMILIAAYTISAIGNNLPATLILFNVQYVLESPYADAFLMLYFVTGIVFLPGWVALARHRQEAPGCVVPSTPDVCRGVLPGSGGRADLRRAGVFIGHRPRRHPGAALLDPGRRHRLRRTAHRRTTGGSVHRVVVHCQEARRGGRRGRRPVDSRSGRLRPECRAARSGAAGPAGLYALVPSVCNLVALAIAFAYPISGAAHQRILEAIERRKKGDPVEDPLKPGVMITPEG